MRHTKVSAEFSFNPYTYIPVRPNLSLSHIKFEFSSIKFLRNLASFNTCVYMRSVYNIYRYTAFFKK